MGASLRDRSERLRLSAEQARAFAALNDPAAKQWFRDEEARIVSELLGAKTDDERRELAASGRAVRDLAQFIYGILRDGERAERELSERHH